MQSEMYLFIADISGYTAYMIKNKMDYTHGVLIINELMKDLVRNVEIPMEISKLEGDAVFFYLPEAKISQLTQNNPHFLSEKLLAFFQLFAHKLEELQKSTACDCGGCSNIHNLNLKIIVHYGKAAIETIGSFRELSGVDVILLHRLLKNHIRGKCYLLFTDQAYKKLAPPATLKMISSEEIDPDLGRLPIHVYYPPGAEKLSEKASLSPFQKFLSHFKLFYGALLLKYRTKKAPFHHLPPP